MDLSRRFRDKLQCSNSRTGAGSGHLERREHGKRRCSFIPRRLCSKILESGGASIRSSHQSSRASCCSRKFSSCQSRRSGSSSSGQQSGPLLHPQTGRNKEFNFVERGLSSVEREHPKRHIPSQSSLVSNIRQCVCGFSKPTRSGGMGISVIQTCVLHDNGAFSIIPHVRCLCKQGYNTITQIHDMGVRPQSSGQKCLDTQVGSDNLPVSSCPIGDELLTEDSTGETDSCFSGPQMANSTLVAIGAGDDVRTSTSTSQVQINPGTEGQLPKVTLPGPSCGSTPSSSNITSSLQSFLSNHLSDGTKNGYKYAFSKFVAFCSGNNYCPKTCGPEIIAQYLKQLFDDGASYSSVNLARSAISKNHDGFYGNSAGSHKLISTAVKAVFRMRPPLPKYKNTYDITLVLDFLKSLPQNDKLTLKQLSLKALFLLIMSSLSRVSSVARLGPDLLVYKVR